MSIDKHYISEATEIDDSLQQNAPQLAVMPKEHVFFLFRGIIDPLISEINHLRNAVNVLVENAYRSRHFVDTPVSISANVSYEVDYKERHMLFVYTQTALSFILAGPQGGNTVGPTTPNVWFNVSAPRGTKITVVGVSDGNPVVVVFRASDVSMV